MTLGDSAHAGEPSRSSSNDDLERELGRLKLPRDSDASAGLLNSQYAILRFLDDAGNDEGPGEQTMTVMAAAMALDPSTVSRQICGAETDGLIARRTSSRDGRARTLMLTPQGRQQLSTTKTQRCALLQSATSNWSTDELTAFIELLRRLNKIADPGA